MKQIFPKNKRVAVVLTLGLVLGLGGCANIPEDDGSQYRALADARAAFDVCHSDASARSQLAAQESTAALYYSAASTMDACLSSVGHKKVMVSSVAMRAHALATTDYIKAGDLSAARDALTRFEERYSGKDLYFADGSSFIDSARLLLAGYTQNDVAPGSLLNAGKQLKSELRRADYWQQH